MAQQEVRRSAGGNSPENTWNAETESYEPEAPASAFRRGPPFTSGRFGLVWPRPSSWVREFLPFALFRSAVPSRLEGPELTLRRHRR